MSPLNTFLLTVAVVFAAKTFAWLLQLRTRNAGLVDAIWGWTLGALAPLYAFFGSGPEPVRWAVAILGGAWGLRLGTHLWRRNHGKPEDWRYARFRQQWGEKADFNMFWFFQFQNLFTLLLSASAFLIPVFRDDAPPAWAFALAVMLWMIAVAGEGIADSQMDDFRRNPANKGRVCREGLWRYSRHPNYFFECLHWLAYVPLAFGASYWWLSLGAPLVMAWLLLKLSGVPLLEAEMAQRKPGYAEYIRSTSVLIPLPPKKS